MKSNFKVPRLLLKIVLVLIILSVVGVLVFIGLQISGKRRLYEKSSSKRPDLASAVTSMEVEKGSEAPDDEKDAATPIQIITNEDSDNWEEGDIRYEGVHYRYNSEMLTFLFMGVDKEGTVKEAKDGYDGGQSDTLFLLALNPKTKNASLISINRDTMALVDIYDKAGNYVCTTPSQITLQHGYGDGKELSCERSVKAVSRLFYDLPIHGYCAINVDAIPKINDAIGGVDLTAMEDVYFEGKQIFKKGQNLHLKGKQATIYLRARDCDSFGSAGRRTERQKQYVAAYADTCMKAMKKDVTILVSLFKTISKYMVTDFTVDEVSYFSTQATEYRFGESSIYSLQGETVMGENFEEFHADEKALLELIIKVFYDVIED